MNLDASVRKLNKVGAKKQELLAKIGIHSLGDVIAYKPIRYEDMREAGFVCDEKVGTSVLVKVKIISIAVVGGYRGSKKLLKLLCVDGQGSKIEILYFNSPYLSKSFNKGELYYAYGVLQKAYSRYQISHPKMLKEGEFARGIFPIYLLPRGISQKEYRRYVLDVLKNARIEESLPRELIDKRKLCDIGFYYQNIHFPRSKEYFKIAKYRGIYEELFVMQIGISQSECVKGEAPQIGASCEEFIGLLPFDLTNAQKRVIGQCESDFSSSLQMNRLLQGDVGSGKTAVAEALMYAVAKSGYQSAIMTPTDILARQHFVKMRKDFEKHGIRTKLLVGSMKQGEKREVYEELERGEVDVLVGTHALFQQSVKFKNLAFVVIDEQHRFGVRQREKFLSKGENPHVLLMTATPIPRTISVLLYAGLDMSIIDEYPEGRFPIATEKATNKVMRQEAYKELFDEVQRGGQGYVVAPLIEESEELEGVFDVISLKTDVIKMARGRDLRIEIIHGAMRKDEKEAVMKAFVAGDVQILIATVVIEVGVDVPNATMMIIENAERFGLSQLHQLRGRVGRGSKASKCYLVSESRGEIAKRRIDIMCGSQDGFYISEKDLELRGPGEVFGTRQHGLPDESIVFAMKYAKVLEQVKEDLAEFENEIPQILYDRADKMFGDGQKLVL